MLQKYFGTESKSGADCLKVVLTGHHLSNAKAFDLWTLLLESLNADVVFVFKQAYGLHLFRQMHTHTDAHTHAHIHQGIF